MGTKKVFAVVAALLMGGAAYAQDEDRDDDKLFPSRRGIDLTLGAGVSNYAQDFNSITQPGVGYGLRVGFHPLSAIGFELAYNGGVNELTLSDENIVTNQANADVKLGVQLGPVAPYVFGGVGVMRVTVPDAAEVPGIDDDTLLTIPWGGGISFDLMENFTLEGRFQYDTMVEESFGVNDNLDADFWTATLNLGTVIGKR